MMAVKQGMYRAWGLTQAEVTEIELLMQVCNAHEGLDLKLNLQTLRSRPRDEVNDFLYYEQGVLVGFLGLYVFNPHEAEISGMVHPQYRRKAIFTTLLQAAYAECLRRGIPRLLLIVEHASLSGQVFISTLSTTYDHAEYKMVLEEAHLPTSFDEDLQFREAHAEDIAALTHITALAFDLSEQGVDWYAPEMLVHPTHRYYVAVLKDAGVIGKLDVSLGEQEAFIYGFGVLPAYRGRGYGRQLLARTIQAVLALGKTRVALEVVTLNKNALSLYQSCGFKETGSYDYYALAVSHDKQLKKK